MLIYFGLSVDDNQEDIHALISAFTVRGTPKTLRNVNA